MTAPKLKQLPVNERSFNLDVTGNVTGRAYVGEFVAVCVMTLKARAAMGVLEARLNAGLEVSDEVRGIHQLYSQLKYRLLKAPDWFIESDYGMNLMDENVMLEIFLKCQEAEKEYRDSLTPKAEEEPKLESTTVKG